MARGSRPASSQLTTTAISGMPTRIHTSSATGTLRPRISLHQRHHEQRRLRRHVMLPDHQHEVNHWPRDLDWDGDRSQLRRGSAPQIMAGLRNLATGLIHASGRTQIAPTLRWVARNPIPSAPCYSSARLPDQQFLLCAPPWE